MTGWPNESSVTLWLNVILTPRIKERRFLRQFRSSLSSKYSYVVISTIQTAKIFNYFVTSRDSTAPLRFLATFIYRAILRRHHLCYRSVDTVKKRRLGIERDSRFGRRNAKWTRTPLERSSRWSSDLLPRFPCDLRDPPSSKWLEQVVRSEHYRLPR